VNPGRPAGSSPLGARPLSGRTESLSRRGYYHAPYPIPITLRCTTAPTTSLAATTTGGNCEHPNISNNGHPGSGCPPTCAPEKAALGASATLVGNGQANVDTEGALVEMGAHLFSPDRGITKFLWKTWLGLSIRSRMKRAWREFAAGGARSRCIPARPHRPKGPKIVFHAQGCCRRRETLVARGHDSAGAPQGEFCLCDGKDRRQFHSLSDR